MAEHQRVIGIRTGFGKHSDAVALRRRAGFRRWRLRDRFRLLDLFLGLRQRDIGLLLRRRWLHNRPFLLPFVLGWLRWRRLGLLHGRAGRYVPVLNLWRRLSPR